MRGQRGYRSKRVQAYHFGVLPTLLLHDRGELNGFVLLECAATLAVVKVEEVAGVQDERMRLLKRRHLERQLSQNHLTSFLAYPHQTRPVLLGLDVPEARGMPSLDRKSVV